MVKAAYYSILIIFTLVFMQSPSYAKNYIGGNFQLKNSLDTSESYCFDLFGFGMNLEMNETISARTCKNPGWPDTTFRVDYPEQGQIYAIDLDLCVQATNFARGAHLILRPCLSSNLQQFNYLEDQTVRLRNEDNSRELCVVVNSGAGTPMDGGGLHLRREIFLYECGRAELQYAQWLVPAESTSSSPLAEKNELSPASTGSDIPGRAVYTASCSRCHGVNAEGRQDIQSPRLAGLLPEYINLQFYNFVNGKRGRNENDNERWAAQMVYIVDHLSERNMSAMDDVFTYISGLSESNIKMEKTILGDVESGAQIYQSQCALCHGSDGLGVSALKSPKLAGTQDWYLLKQLEKFRDGRRGFHADDKLGAQMVPLAKLLSPEDSVDVVSYINQLSIGK